MTPGINRNPPKPNRHTKRIAASATMQPFAVAVSPTSRPLRARRVPIQHGLDRCRHRYKPVRVEYLSLHSTRTTPIHRLALLIRQRANRRGVFVASSSGRHGNCCRICNSTLPDDDRGEGVARSSAQPAPRPVAVIPSLACAASIPSF